MDAVKRPDKKKRTVNEHYHRLAARVRAIRYFVLFVLVVVMLGGMWLFGDEITINNVRYLLRYIDIQAPSLGGDTSSTRIYIDGAPDMAVGYYKGDVTVLTSSGLEMYDFSGSKTFDYAFEKSGIYSKPMMAISEKYVLTYDLAGNKFALFNSFSNVYTPDRLDGAIYKASINESGDFAIVSTASGYRSIVTVYNASFKPLFKWSTIDKYVMDAALDKSGKQIAVVSFSASDGDLLTTLKIFAVSSEDEIADLPIKGSLPVDIEWTDDGGVILISDSALTYYDGTLNEQAQFPFSGQILYNYAITDKNVILALKSTSVDNSTYLYVLDKKGNQLYTQSFDDDVLDVGGGGGSVYMLSRQGLYKIKLEDQQCVSLEYDPMTGADRIIYASQEQVIITSSTVAEIHREKILTAAESTTEDVTTAEQDTSGG